jgi:type IV/VI secretion system ImpK/VasF family protein
MVQLITAFKVAAHNAAFESEDIEDAVLALVAFADAVASKVVGVTWNNRLQFEVYGHRRAGTDVSQKLLPKLRANAWKHIQALEVAGQCLLLGFEGELAGKSAEEQSAFVASVMNDIAGVRGTALPPLAPEAVRPVRGAGTVGGAIPLAWTIAGFVLALALVWSIVVISVGHHAHSVARGLLDLPGMVR